MRKREQYILLNPCAIDNPNVTIRPSIIISNSIKINANNPNNVIMVRLSLRRMAVIDQTHHTINGMVSAKLSQ